MIRMLTIAVCDDEVTECYNLSLKIREMLGKMKVPCIVRQFNSAGKLFLNDVYYFEIKGRVLYAEELKLEMDEKRELEKLEREEAIEKVREEGAANQEGVAGEITDSVEISEEGMALLEQSKSNSTEGQVEICQTAEVPENQIL